MVTDIHQFIKKLESINGNRPAIRYYDEQKEEIKEITYEEYIYDIKRYASFLHEVFPDKRAHIGALAKNSYAYAVFLFAAMLADMVVVPLNIENSWEEIKTEIQFSDIVALFVDDNVEELFPDFNEETNIEKYDIGSFVSNHELWKADSVDNTQTAMIMFTSGTTGTSKGIMISQKAFFSNLTYLVGTIAQEHLEANVTDPSMLYLFPLYHMGGLDIFTLSLAAGITVDFCSSLKYMYRDLKLMKSTSAIVPPMVLNAFAKDISTGKNSRLGNIRRITSTSAKSNPELFDLFRKNGIIVSNAYGASETCGAGTFNTGKNAEKDRSVGTVSKGSQIKIDSGEICIKTGSVMLGYYKDKEATDMVLKNGWIHTGDLGYFDADGYLYLTGRKKNLIILSGGENVSPEELEALLTPCDSIIEALVYEEGDHIHVKISCDPCNETAIQEYIRELNRSLPMYKRITKIHFIHDKLPRTGSYKIKRGRT